MSIQDILAKRAAEKEAEAKANQSDFNNQGNVSTGIQSTADPVDPPLQSFTATPTVLPGQKSPDELLQAAIHQDVKIDPGTGERFHIPPVEQQREIVNQGATADQTGVETVETKVGNSDITPTPGGYKAIRLQRFADQNGVWVYPDKNGYFVPADDWQRNELNHFAAQYQLVEAPLEGTNEALSKAQFPSDEEDPDQK